jgi:hypothetical protein
VKQLAAFVSRRAYHVVISTDIIVNRLATAQVAVNIQRRAEEGVITARVRHGGC